MTHSGTMKVGIQSELNVMERRTAAERDVMLR